MGLDRSEFLRKDISISNWDLGSSLGVELMDEKGFLFLVVIVESWLDGGQNIVWLEANHVVKEPSELVDF